MTTFSQNFTIGTTPEFVGVGDVAQMTVLNIGPATVYYGGATVTTGTGTSLASGASVTITAGQYFVCATSSHVRAYPAAVTSSATATVNGEYDVTATAYGADPTGATDCKTAIQAAVDAASAAGGGVVYLPPGTYKTLSRIVWKSKVSLRGAGTGVSILKPSGVDHACISRDVTLDGATSGDPITDAFFEDFEIDGSAMTVSAYQTYYKGISISHCLRLRANGLYIHDTAATGLAFDFAVDSSIHACVVTGTGRLNDGTQGGGNGIGIATRNATNEEPCVVSDCTVKDAKRYGIFWESGSGSASSASSGVRVLGNYVSGCQRGIGLCGTRRMVCTGNSVTANTVAGIAADGGTIGSGRADFESLIANNVCYANPVGIWLNYEEADNTNGKLFVTGNYCGVNTSNGIRLTLDTVSPADLIITNNVLHSNVGSGFRAYYNGATNTGVWSQSEFSRNVLYDNGTGGSAGNKDGIRIEVPCTDVQLRENRCFDRQGVKTQDTGLTISATFTGGSIVGNDLRGNKTLAASAATTTNVSTTTALGSNVGWTPIAPIAISVTASPFTYTAGLTPEVAWIYGGTVSSVTVGAFQVASTTNVMLLLEPGDAVVVTYSVAPTMAGRRRA